MTKSMIATLHQAMARFLTARGVADVHEVTGFEQYQFVWSGCPTCGGDETRVSIDYVRCDGSTGSYEYSGDLGELIRALTDE